MIKRIFSYFGKYRKYAVLTLFSVLAETMFELVIPFIMSDIIDVGVATGNKAYILQQGGLMIVCALASFILGACSSRFAALSGQGLGAELRKAEYAKLQQFSFANTDHFSTSSLVTRLTSDITAIQNSVSNGCRPAFRAPVMLLTSLIFAFVLNRTLSIVLFVAAPILGFLLFQIVSHVRPMYTLMQGAVDTVNRTVQENLTAVRVVKSYVRGDYETEKFQAVNEDLRRSSERAFRLTVLNMPAMQFVMYGTILCILWVGGNLVFDGQLLVGQLTGFLSYVLQVLNSLMLISNVFMMLTRSLASGRRILEVLDEEIDIKEENTKDLSVEKGDITFDHVFFKYKQSAKEYVLSDICLDIKGGQTIGIIGETGAAKTSLVQLIPRLYDTTEGEVRIDGHPVTEYPLRHLRDAIAVVLQKNTLFSGTVRDNLRWGKEDATEDEIEEACRVAAADEFISRLDNGYDTELGQGGVNVSGGQKQRLCIARALLKHPRVLILDDSTSAVDTATEARIREGLARYLPGTTKIIIAQRISSVLHADQIIILQDGKINAVGNHETLLAKNKIYQEIYHSQQEGAGL